MSSLNPFVLSDLWPEAGSGIYPTFQAEDATASNPVPDPSLETNASTIWSGPDSPVS